MFWGHFVKNWEVYTGETNILVNVMALGLECQADTQKYCFRKKGKKITDLIECDFCHVELCGGISAIAGKIKFSFLWLHSENRYSLKYSPCYVRLLRKLSHGWVDCDPRSTWFFFLSALLSVLWYLATEHIVPSLCRSGIWSLKNPPWPYSRDFDWAWPLCILSTLWGLNLGYSFGL